MQTVRVTDFQGTSTFADLRSCTIVVAVSDSARFDRILVLMEERGLLGDGACDVVTLERAAGIRVDDLSMESMDDYLAHAEGDPTELKELVAAVVDARSQLQADELVPEVEVGTVFEQLKATTHALEQANEERRSTLDDLSEVDRELTLVATELDVVTGQLDERIREVERLNDFVQGILAMVKRPMIVVDGDLTVRAWNEPMATLLKTSLKDAVGRPMERLGPSFKTGAIAGAVARALSGEGPDSTPELQLPGHLETEVVVTAITDSDGRVVGAVIRVDPADPI